MGYSVGQYTSPDSSGVGTTQNNTGSTGQPAYGGKGGGTAAQPTTTSGNALAQPAQSSTNPYATTVPAGAPTVKPTPTPVFGQNALGYNMGRLSRLMDPSASLPAPKPQTPQPQPQAQPQQTQQATGGKGGGYGVTADDLNALGAFLSMPADTFGNTNLAGYNNQDTSRDAYNRHMATAFYNGKPPTYEEWVQQRQSIQKPYGPRYDEDNPYGVTGSQRYQQDQEQYQVPYQSNPFEGQTALYQQQMQQMQDMYQQQLDMMREQMKSMKDTGAEIYDLPDSYDKYGYTTTGEQEKKTAEKEAAEKAAAEAAAKKKEVVRSVNQKRSIAPGQIKQDSNGMWVYKDPKTGVYMKTYDKGTAQKNAKVIKKAHGGVIHNGMSNKLKHMLGED